MRKIAEYQIGWNPALNRGYITIKLEGESQRRNVTINSNDEFLALGLILKEDPVYLFPNGLIGTGPEAPGG